MTAWVWPVSAASAMVSTVASSIWRWPTSATGACSQRPMQGARSTRTSAPSRAGRAASRAWAPCISQLRESQTRTVRAGGGVSPSVMMSKWA